MLTRRRSARAAVSRKREEEEKQQLEEEEEKQQQLEEEEEVQISTETCQQDPEPELPDRTSVPGEESTATEAMNSEKENQANAMDSNPAKRSRTAAHAQTGAGVGAGRTAPLGKPKSGRVWKDRNKQRFSALLRDKPLRSSWQKKMEAKREKELVRKYNQTLKDQKAKEKEDKRKRREENLKRREENERKAEIVQVIRNTAKLKRMKKKQLRKIEKRDTLSMLQKTPPAVKKAGKAE